MTGVIYSWLAFTRQSIRAADRRQAAVASACSFVLRDASCELEARMMGELRSGSTKINGFLVDLAESGGVARRDVEIPARSVSIHCSPMWAVWRSKQLYLKMLLRHSEYVD